MRARAARPERKDMKLAAEVEGPRREYPVDCDHEPGPHSDPERENSDQTSDAPETAPSRSHGSPGNGHYGAVKRSPARYFSPLSTATVAATLPGPSSPAIRTAAAMFRPLDVPTNMPSSRARRRAMARPSASSTARASS